MFGNIFKMQWMKRNNGKKTKKNKKKTKKKQKKTQQTN